MPHSLILTFKSKFNFLSIEIYKFIDLISIIFRFNPSILWSTRNGKLLYI